MTMQVAVSISRIFIRLFRMKLVLENKLFTLGGPYKLTVPVPQYLKIECGVERVPATSITQWYSEKT